MALVVTLAGISAGAKGDRVSTESVLVTPLVGPVYVDLSGGGAADSGVGGAYYGRMYAPVARDVAEDEGRILVDDVPGLRPTVSEGSAAPVLPVERESGADWVSLLSAYSWPLGEAEAVLACESSGDPSARNGSSVGLMQINTAAHPYTVGQMLDPEQNIAAAYAIWADSGWSPWSCQP